MPTYNYPGVYMEEVSSGVRPIQAAGTSTAAFFGVAERGPINSVKKIFNFTEFQAHYGGFVNGQYLAHAALQFFNNGGSQLYIGRVAVNPITASVTVLDRGGAAQNSATLSASSPGQWGNRVMVTVADSLEDPANLFNVAVFQDNAKAGDPPVLLESFANLTMNPSDPDYAVTVINTRSKVLRLAANLGNTNQIAGYSESAAITLGGPLLGANQRQFRINVHGDGVRLVTLAADLGGADVTSLAALGGVMQAAIRTLAPLRDSTPAQVYQVTVSVQGGNRLRIASGQASAGSRVEISDGPDDLANLAGALRLGKRRQNQGAVEVFGAANMRPQNTAAGDFYFLGDDTVSGAVSAVASGGDGTLPQDIDFINALRWLDTVRDVSLIACPGIGSESVADAGMNYCRNVRPLSDCFYIADMAADDDTLEEAIAYRDNINGPNSYGAVYFPWLKTLDPTGQSPEPILVPPSGFVAGLFGQIDSRRGVWKAPAGTEAIVGGAVGLGAEITDVQQGNLNTHPKSVSVIRKFPGSGIVLWGARTLSSDPEYNYVPVRRMAIMLRVSIFNGIQWAVFEPNDVPLWNQLRLNITAFMSNLFRQGAFQGTTQDQAFFVKCDAETTTQDDINLGIVNVKVGFAPLKPAEFVVVKISQKAGQSG